MGLRQTGERLRLSASLKRPTRPEPIHTAFDVAIHDVHLGLIWLHEQTDANVERLYWELATTTVTPQRLSEIAELALVELLKMSDHFAPANYDAIYQHLRAGLQ